MVPSKQSLFHLYTKQAKKIHIVPLDDNIVHTVLPRMYTNQALHKIVINTITKQFLQETAYLVVDKDMGIAQKKQAID